MGRLLPPLCPHRSEKGPVQIGLVSAMSTPGCAGTLTSHVPWLARHGSTDPSALTWGPQPQHTYPGPRSRSRLCWGTTARVQDSLPAP